MKKNNRALKDLIFQAKIQGMFVFLSCFAIIEIKSFIFAIPLIP
tara:strand:- start:334 stop:465 length:132 start_codon:yes stop_codon:yes gene_type:complete